MENLADHSTSSASSSSACLASRSSPAVIPLQARKASIACTEVYRLRAYVYFLKFFAVAKAEYDIPLYGRSFIVISLQQDLWLIGSPFQSVVELCRLTAHPRSHALPPSCVRKQRCLSNKQGWQRCKCGYYAQNKTSLLASPCMGAEGKCTPWEYSVHCRQPPSVMRLLYVLYTIDSGLSLIDTSLYGLSLSPMEDP